MTSRRTIVNVGPVAVEVPAAVGGRLAASDRFLAWSGGDLLTVSVGRYSLALTDRATLVVRRYRVRRRWPSLGT